jgi:hypothetical protein
VALKAIGDGRETGIRWLNTATCATTTLLPTAATSSRCALYQSL